MNLLHRIPSIKIKIGVVIIFAIVVAAVFTQIGARLGWPTWLSPVVACAVSLGFVHVLARGMTRPLRQIESAVKSMAMGDYRQRVETESVDEAGRLADAFNAMSAELAAIEQERRDLIANVSHELRTPLAAVRAQLENMADGFTPSTADQLALTLAQCARLEDLISRLMNLSRIESGQTDLVAAPVVLHDLLHSATAEARLRSPQTTFDVDCGDDLKTTLDEQLFHQVLANVLDNAAKHAPAATAVHVSARQSRNATTIEIRDQGPGVAPAHAERIFERFYRVDADRSASSGGSGIGLSIARSIVELHGGRIHAEANQPSGLAVIIEL